MNDAESAAEGSILGTWKFQEYKSQKHLIPKITLFESAERFVDKHIYLTKFNTRL